MSDEWNRYRLPPGPVGGYKKGGRPVKPSEDLAQNRRRRVRLFEETSEWSKDWFESHLKMRNGRIQFPHMINLDWSLVDPVVGRTVYVGKAKDLMNRLCPSQHTIWPLLRHATPEDKASLHVALWREEYPSPKEDSYPNAHSAEDFLLWECLPLANDKEHQGSPAIWKWRSPDFICHYQVLNPSSPMKSKRPFGSRVSGVYAWIRFPTPTPTDDGWLDRLILHGSATEFSGKHQRGGVLAELRAKAERR